MAGATVTEDAGVWAPQRFRYPVAGV